MKSIRTSLACIVYACIHIWMYVRVRHGSPLKSFNAFPLSFHGRIHACFPSLRLSTATAAAAVLTYANYTLSPHSDGSGAV